MKTRKFCPKCGRPLLKSQVKGYAFQCFACDEDFYRFEVYRLKDLPVVRKIQRMTHFDELADGLPPASVKKPYRRPQLTKHQKVNNNGTTT
jgi:transcriptional regulator NrdR family protein